MFSACDTEPDTQEELLQNLSSFLSPDQSQLCDGYLTADEVLEALKGMARGKSPGSDGLPVEFYLTFWDLLGDDLVEVLNASFDAGLLPFSQRGALITLIHKKGDRLLHKNWRPISLLNIDYKICARALAGRLLKVLQFVIHPDQTCGVRGRYILGVYFSNGLISVESDNWKARLGKLQSVLNLWKQRELSFLGRAMIVNVLGASCFWHTAKILAPPPPSVGR